MVKNQSVHRHINGMPKLLAEYVETLEDQQVWRPFIAGIWWGLTIDPDNDDPDNVDLLCKQLMVSLEAMVNREACVWEFNFNRWITSCGAHIQSRSGIKYCHNCGKPVEVN